jgi:hypothetical protein
MRKILGCCDRCFWGDVGSVTGRALLAPWGGSTGIKGSRTALEPIYRGGDCEDQTVTMQGVGGRRRSSADGVVLFLLWLAFRQVAAGTLRRLDRDRGSSGCLMPAFSAVFGCRKSGSRQGGALPAECSIRSGRRGLSCLCRGSDCHRSSQITAQRGESKRAAEAAECCARKMQCGRDDGDGAGLAVLVTVSVQCTDGVSSNFCFRADCDRPAEFRT